MVKAILFDCFGVLLADGLRVAVQKYSGGDPKKIRAVWDVVHASSAGMLSYQDVREQGAAILGVSTDEWMQAISSGEQRNDELFAYIATLRPKYKTAVVSNVSAGGLLRRFSQAELDEYFDVVIASGDHGVYKPDRAIFELAAEKLGVKLNECILVDDNEDYCGGAEAVGVRAVLYTDVEQAKAELQKLLADTDN